MTVKYLGMTENGVQYRVDEIVSCLACGWRGKESQLKDIPWHPEDDYSIEGETERVCPQCESSAWEPE